MRTIGAVILAAGGSSRFGQPKQLLSWRGETLIRRAVRAASEARCDPVIVVAGETSGTLRFQLDIRESRISSSRAPGNAAQIIVIKNAKWRNGLGTSIRRGLEQLAGSVEAAVFLTCDQPYVDASIVKKLIAEREKTGKPIVASSYANTLGVPALFDCSLFKELRALPDNLGAKALIEERANEVASIEFEGGAADIDTPEDFKRLDEIRG